jgi:two-component system, sensor histidine kinase and response regulator
MVGAVMTYRYLYPIDPATPVLEEVSENIGDVTGYPAEVWREDPYLWQRLLHPEDAQGVIAATWMTTFQRVSYEQTYRMVTRDSRIVWIHDVAEVEVLEDGAEIWRGTWTVIPEPEPSDEPAE